jgi:Polyketide cyclase / dehydrase and lipid transport
VKTQQMTKYILGGAIAMGLTFLCASSNAQATEKNMNEALTINADGAQRNPDIHWPKGQHPEDADLFAHSEIMVNASCETVFADIVDAQSWPSWYPNSHNVVVHNSPDNKLHEGTKFSWDTFGVHIESTVHELVPNSRIGWWGLGTGMKAYHTFLLVNTDQGCHIITEEVVRGEGAIKFRQEQPNAMHDGHDLWLKVIKERSEKQN